MVLIISGLKGEGMLFISMKLFFSKSFFYFVLKKKSLVVILKEIYILKFDDRFEYGCGQTWKMNIFLDFINLWSFVYWIIDGWFGNSIFIFLNMIYMGHFLVTFEIHLTNNILLITNQNSIQFINIKFFKIE